MKIKVLDTALDDLESGFLFYDNQKQGLGDYFLDTLWSDIISLRLCASIHSKRYAYYCMFSKRFPYAIYYKVGNNIAYIHAVLDCRRNPKWIRKRLGQ
jgi:hypothetical protein